MHKDESLINFSVGVNTESESLSLSDVLEITDLRIFAKNTLIERGSPIHVHNVRVD